jgi:hypothetical protein
MLLEGPLVVFEVRPASGTRATALPGCPCLGCCKGRSDRLCCVSPALLGALHCASVKRLSPYRPQVGCGVGNTVFPLLEINPHITIHACDFSPRAVQVRGR